MTLNLPERIPEEEVAAILTRAAELDRNARETVNLEAVRMAALEAGISPGAVDAALEEYAAGQVDAGGAGKAANEAGAEPESPRWKRVLRSLVSPVVHGAAALAVGTLVGGAGEGGEPLAVVGFLAFFYACWRLIRKHRPTRKVRVYQISVALMTFAGILGITGAGGDEEVAATFFATAAFLFVAGSLAIKLRVTGTGGKAPGGTLAGPTS